VVNLQKITKTIIEELEFSKPKLTMAKAADDG
jgi:hypothetical protein